MCLAIIAANVITDWPLVVIANRDELHNRPTLPAAPWSDAAEILGGRDLRAGGTWLGVTAQGRMALLTNYREPGQNNPLAPSRGQLTDRFLRGEKLAMNFAQELQLTAAAYNGFNLLLADSSGTWFVSNRAGVKAQQVKAGVVGISNASLNTPWPKLTRTQQAVSEYLALKKDKTSLEPEFFFEIMQDTRTASIEELPDTGVGPERERLLGSPFIKDERYGTRCTTLIMKRSDGMMFFHEKCFDSRGLQSCESRWTINTVKQSIVPGTADIIKTLC